MGYIFCSKIPFSFANQHKYHESISIENNYRIRSNTIRAFNFPKWLFGAHSIQIKCKFAHSIQEYSPKTGLLTQKCVFYCNFNKVRIQFKLSSVLERIRYMFAVFQFLFGFGFWFSSYFWVWMLGNLKVLFKCEC